MKAGPFSRALGLSETTVRNYLDRSSKPSSDVLEKIYNTFSHDNLVWLVAGKGEPFIDSDSTPQARANISGEHAEDNISSGRDNAAQNNSRLAACEKERDLALTELAGLQRQLVMAQALIASKEETISFLRGNHTRPE